MKEINARIKNQAEKEVAKWAWRFVPVKPAVSVYRAELVLGEEVAVTVREVCPNNLPYWKVVFDAKPKSMKELVELARFWAQAWAEGVAEKMAVALADEFGMRRQWP